jgi:hypothetical protein
MGSGSSTAPINNSVELLAFWPANIAACFALVEDIFELRNIALQRAHYFNYRLQ